MVDSLEEIPKIVPSNIRSKRRKESNIVIYIINSTRKRRRNIISIIKGVIWIPIG